MNTERSKISLWMQAIRAFAYPGSIVPVAVSSMFALCNFHGNIDWFLLPFIMLSGMLLHTGGNLASDYFDFRKNVDRKETLGSSRILVNGLLQPKQILTGAMVSFGLAILLGSVIIYFKGYWILVLGLIGIAGGYFYGAYPLQLKFHALGDFVIFLLFGVLMVMGTYYALTGTFVVETFYLSIPVGFLVVGILHANNTRDIMHDSVAKIRTLAMVLGIKGAQFEYYFLVFGAFLTVVILIGFRILPPWALLVFLSFPVALKNVREMAKAQIEKPEVIAMLDVKTAQHHLQFGLLLSVGLLISYFV